MDPITAGLLAIGGILLLAAIVVAAIRYSWKPFRDWVNKKFPL